MAGRLAALILFLLVPALGYAHTEIIFPKLFSPAELQNTGFVVASPEAFPTTVEFVLVSGGGVPGARTSLQIPAGGQISKLGGELFPGASAGGWVYAVNDGEGMEGFWLSYDDALTFMDGAAAAQLDSIGADQVIPLVAGQTELNVINPNGITTSISIRLFGNDDPLGSAFSLSLTQVAGFQAQVSTCFSVDMSQARCIRIQTSGAPISSSAVIRGYLVSSESGVINGVNVTPRTELMFPHVINGSLGESNYTTVIGVANVSGSSQTVTITFTPDGGSPLEVLRTLAPGGALRETAQTLFGLSSAFRSGWVRIRGFTIAGFAAYADSLGGALAVVPAAASQPSFNFLHIANGPPQWQTGLVLMNLNASPANVELTAMTPSGAPVGSASFTLDVGGKTANVLHQWIPETLGLNGGFVIVKTANSTPLYGVELFYTQDLHVLSNVAAGKGP